MYITSNCTGCRACEQLCPKNCIEMKADKEGFIYPVINEDKCVNCGLCKKRCPQNNEFHRDRKQMVYALRMKDDAILKNSASGGAFAVFAMHILKSGGAVFGAAYDEQLRVKHIKITKTEELYKLQSSKYVQSDTENTYRECKQCLESGKKVLYSGTPCQIAGLYSYLGKDHEQLLTMDLICHGVPSPLLFEKYLEWLGHKLGGKIIEYDFRNKEKMGWGLGYKTKTKTKTKYYPADFDPYYREFLAGSIYRECCYKCKYAARERIGDITIGDFWGIENYHREFMNRKGISVIAVNSSKGARSLEAIKDKVYMIESDMDKAAAGNHNLNAPTERPKKRDVIYNGIEADALNYMTNNFCVKIQLASLVKHYTPKPIKKYIKKMLIKNK